jgi:ABC-2 type transport system permease protein
MPWGIIASNDLRLLLRDPMALFWVVAFPLVFAVFLGSVMKASVEAKTPPMKVVVVGAAGLEAADQLAGALDRAGLRVTRESAETASNLVRRGEALAFIRMASEGGSARIELGIDPSRRSEAALLRSLLATALAGPEAAAAASAVRTVSVVRDSDEPRSGFDIVFPAMILWGMIGCASTFAVAMVGERASGTLLRLRAAPIRRASILGGKAAACVMTCLTDALLLSLIGAFLLGIRIDHLGKYAMVVSAIVLCFAGLTLALSVLGSSDQAVASAAWATLLLMAMLGGAMVPIFLMPEWLLPLSDLSPVKWGITALEGATWRDLGWSDLVRPIVQLMALGVIGFASGVAILVSWREV